MPLSTYTEAYWKVDLHNLLHFLMLRMDAHAQAEIRAYATVIGNQVVAKWVPITWEAFLDYRLGALQISRLEAEILRAIPKSATQAANIARRHGLLNRDNQGNLTRNRERAELEHKINILGLSVPWTASN